ncbi:MAG: hypothetical protein AAFR70_14785, partial [Pseudomonadota bacterium]
PSGAGRIWAPIVFITYSNGFHSAPFPPHNVDARLAPKESLRHRFNVCLRVVAEQRWTLKTAMD